MKPKVENVTGQKLNLEMLKKIEFWVTPSDYGAKILSIYVKQIDNVIW